VTARQACGYFEYGIKLRVGVQALVAPARLIANNAGVEGDVIIEKLMGQPFEMGYNAVRTLLDACDLHHFLVRTAT